MSVEERTMRVLIANNYFYLRGGSERVMFNDMQALADAGIDVVPFSAADPANAPSEYSKHFTRGVDIHATNPFRQIQAAREAIDCERTATDFAALIDETQPDIVHFHNIYGRLTTSILSVVRRRRLPAVLTVHDYKLVCPSYLMLRDGKPCTACVDGGFYRCAVHRCHKHSLATSAVNTAEAYFARVADRYGAISTFLCPSRFMEILLMRFGVDVNRVMYHPNAVDPSAYAPRYQGEYVLYAGRLSCEKGLPTLLHAIAGANIPLRIAGTGPMEEAVRAIVAKGGESIVLEGHCDGARLRNLYQNAAFVVVPSEWYENAPMTVLEAFAYGKPVVATRIGGIPELVTDGGTGYLVDCHAPDQLHTAICNLWRDRDAQRRMGSRARALVETNLSQATRTESLINIYERLCRSRNRTAHYATDFTPLMS
jgi:glycosyltransferase involved in cell wall biosynthesis